MSFFTILPMAIVMIAGPQIVSAILLATSERWRQSSLAYVLGGLVAVTAVVTAAYFLGSGASTNGASDTALLVVILALLVAASVHTFLTRHTAGQPTWMSKLQTASPGFAFKLGLALLGPFPSDLLTSISVGTYVAVHDDPWWHSLGFIGLTVLLLAVPLLLGLALGPRAERVLPKMRDWMASHAWMVNEGVIALFIVIVASEL